MTEEKEMNALDLVDEISRNMSPEKATRALVLIPILRAEIERLMPLDSPVFENTFQANIELHERLGDKPISDCHNVECGKHPEFDYYFCPKCLEVDAEEYHTGDCPPAKYHWEEHKDYRAFLKIAIDIRKENLKDAERLIKEQRPDEDNGYEEGAAMMSQEIKMLERIFNGLQA